MELRGIEMINTPDESNWYQSNKTAYAEQTTVADYQEADYLEPCESRFIDEFRTEMVGWAMLDIAVGAGRTTMHFMPLVANYTGIDYSPPMVEACQAKMDRESDKARIRLGDMSDLSDFPDDSIDFVLISYNAISALPEDLRFRTYSEVARVLRPGGKFLFSTFNLQCIWARLTLKGTRSLTRPLFTLRKFRDRARWVIRANSIRGVLRAMRADAALINDSSHNQRLTHYYIRPHEQVWQLSELFENIRVLDRDGTEVSDPVQYRRLESDWCFYLCDAVTKSV